MNADDEISRQVTIDVVLNGGDDEWRESGTEAACFADVLNSAYANFCGHDTCLHCCTKFFRVPTYI